MKFLLATAALALMASTAMAADLIVEEVGVVDVPAAAYDWSGVYVGVNAGYGSLLANQPIANSDGYWYGSYYGNEDVTGSGFALGVGAGANAQFGNFVLGIEGDVNWADLEATNSDDETYAPDSYYEITSIWDWYATLRAKAGIAVDSALFYVTAGVAAVGSTSRFCYETDYCFEGYGYDYDEEYSETLFGWTAGIGAEVAVADNISLKGEVLYISTPEQTYESPYYDYDSDFQTSAVVGRVGLNLKF